MPRDLMWVMENGDKTSGGTGSISRGRLQMTLGRFRSHIGQQGGIVALMSKYDKNGDGNLSDYELTSIVKAITALHVLCKNLLLHCS